MSIEVGYSLSSEEHGPLDLVRYARAAEEAGFTFALISDPSTRGPTDPGRGAVHKCTLCYDRLKGGQEPTRRNGCGSADRRRRVSDGSITDAGTDMSSYYGRPVLKEPVWQPQIPFYFFTGGLGGASAVLSLGARIVGNEPLASTSLYVGAAADAVSPVLLITDLGRPERFLNMLRVSDTAVPVWHEGRRELPYVFAPGAASSAGAAATALLPPPVAGSARRLALAGAGLKTIPLQLMERRLGFVGEPYKQGAAGALTRASKACTLAGAAVLALGGRKIRTAAAAGSSLLLAGDLLLRWGIFRAGFQSARDPRYTVRPQRERLGAV